MSSAVALVQRMDREASRVVEGVVPGRNTGEVLRDAVEAARRAHRDRGYDRGVSPVGVALEAALLALACVVDDVALDPASEADR